MDAFWAKDIQELFRLERRVSFQRFVELLLAQSGGIFEATKFAAPCEVSRPTITNYLAVLESTGVALVLRPFNTRRSAEIVAAPKVYGFDTGFVCAHRGWTSLRPDDLGRLWEHFVLNEIAAQAGMPGLRYWRDKRGREVDFIWQARGRQPLAIECKWSAGDFDPANLLEFARHYPKSSLLVVSTDARPSFVREYQTGRVQFTDLCGLLKIISAS
jgi:predicted AAA+ superfamily ATPase